MTTPSLLEKLMQTILGCLYGLCILIGLIENIQKERDIGYHINLEKLLDENFVNLPTKIFALSSLHNLKVRE